MLLRSSSTPILTSHLSSDHRTPNHQPISCHLTSPGNLLPPPSGVRRTFSDGNLHLLSDRHSSSTRRQTPSLEPIPSFSMHHLSEEADHQQEEYTNLVSGENPDMGLGQNTSAAPPPDMGLGQNTGAAPPLFLARGLGIDRIGSGLMNVGGGGAWDGGREQSDMEMHYKKLVEEDPSNSLYMRNYAQFLYQVKGDLQRAEEYYSRAILAEPGDGQILAQYAKLVWELHEDEERATSYFEQAVHTAPQDSVVLAAYARFLWEADEGDGSVGRSQECIGSEGDGSVGRSQECIGSVHNGALAC